MAPQSCLRISSILTNPATGTVDANEAITILLVQPGDSGIKKIESFNPKFTYAIFGEEERIFGYKGLKINIQFNASDMRPNASVTSIKKFQTVSEVEAFDVVGTLKEFLPGGLLHSLHLSHHFALTPSSRFPEKDGL